MLCSGNWNTFDNSKLLIVGKDVDKLDGEAGGHRVQRVPPTEKKGRVHTSSVTVAITNPDVQIDDNLMKRSKDDFRVEWFSGTGKGGQHRNKKQNSCRVIHIETGITESRQGRKREANLREATDVINKKLDQQIVDETNMTLDDIRKQQVGSGMRGDKIRTYQFQRNLVKDHITLQQAPCDKVMKGKIDLLWS